MASLRTPRNRRPTQKLLDSRDGIQKKPRQPAKCHICPGFPLKTICGCKKLQANVSPSFLSLNTTTSFNASSSSIDVFSGTAPSLNSFSTTTSFLRTSTIGSSSPDTTSPVPQIPNLSPTPRTLSNLPSVPLFTFPNTFDQEEAQSNLDTSINRELNIENGTSNLTSNTSEFAIDPRLLIQDDVNSDYEDQTPFQETKEKISKRVAPSVKNPIYGLVEGVKRGSANYDVARTRELPVKINMQGTSSSRYRRELPDIITRCERLAMQCDVYMMLVCQQASGSTAAVHYTSPRLRREAKQDTLEIIQNYQSLMNKLLLARRQDALIAIKEKEIAQKEAEEAQEQTRQAEERIKAQETQLQAQNILLQKLQEQMEHLQAQRKED